MCCFPQMVSECQRFDTPDGFFVLLEILLWVSSWLANVEFGRVWWGWCWAPEVGRAELACWERRSLLMLTWCLPGQSSTTVKPFKLFLCSAVKALHGVTAEPPHVSDSFSQLFILLLLRAFLDDFCLEEHELFEQPKKDFVDLSNCHCF